MVSSIQHKLNVLIIGEYFPPDLGGAATRASNVAKGLSLNNCNVTIVTAFPHYPTGKIPNEYKSKPLKIEYIGKSKVIRTFVLPFESKGLLKRLMIFWSFIVSSLAALPFVGEVDVIWAANPDVFVLVPAIIYGYIKRKPVITNVDDLLIEDLYDLDLVKRNSNISKILEFSARVLFSKVKAATPISPGYIQTIAKYGVNKKNIVVIRGGVDLEAFKPQTEQINGTEYIVMYSGGFSIAYDFEQVFKAAKILSIDSSIKFIIQGNGELLGSMLDSIENLHLKNVQIIDKLLSREEVGSLLTQADALILPLANFKTPYRGMSSKIYEYQAVEKPVICCSNGVPGAYVAETKSGLVVYPGDYRALAEAVLRLKANVENSKIMACNGRKIVEKECSIKSVGVKVFEVCREIAT